MLKSVKSKQDIYIHVLREDGQTAGPIGLKCNDTNGWRGVLYAKQNSKFVFFKIFKKNFSTGNACNI